MNKDNNFAADIARIANEIAGTVVGLSREAGESTKERTREWLAGMDFVSREEFETVREMAEKAREENEILKEKLAAIEEKLNISQ